MHLRIVYFYLSNVLNARLVQDSGSAQNKSHRIDLHLLSAFTFNMMSPRIFSKFDAEVKSCSKVHKIPHMAYRSETFITVTGEHLAKSLWAWVFFYDSNFVPGKGISP